MFRYKILIFFAVVGIAASLTAFFIINNTENKRISTLFEKSATERIDLITYSFSMTELVTESLRNLFLSSTQVSKSEFKNFVNSYLKKFKGIKSINWIPRVTYETKDNYIRYLRDEGNNDLTFFKFDEEGNKIPVQKKEEYFPLIYAEPFEENKDNIGYDLGSDEIKRLILTKSRLTKKTTATEKFPELRNNDTLSSVYIFEPVFKSNGYPRSNNSEENELLGFTSCRFSISEIVESSFDIVNSNGINILLFDESALPSRELLYSTLDSQDKERILNNTNTDNLFFSQEFRVADKIWSINCYATKEFTIHNKSLIPTIVLFASLFLTAILIIHNYRIFKERDEISKKVKQRTAELNESNQRLDLALNTADLIVWDWDIDKGTVYLSDKVFKVLGWNMNDLSDIQEWRKLVHPEDSEMVNNLLEKQLKNEIPIFSAEYRIRTKQGDWKWILDVGKVIERNKERRPLRAIGIHMDITDRKTIQDKIIEYNKMLEKDNSDMNRLFSIIGHDLKSPLISIKGFSEFLYNEIKDLSEEEIVQYSKYIFQASNSLHSMLEGLLDWGQMQMGKIVFQPEHTNLYQLADKVVSQFLIMALPKKINIENRISTDFNVFIDKSMISTVLRNLLSNAIKFTPIEGKVTINTEYSGNNEIIISVADTGVGIEPDKLEHLLSDSYNKSTLGTEGEKGTGLGLSLCTDFVERNGGRMWVKSEVGRGTTFYFSIPIQAQTSAPAQS